MDIYTAIATNIDIDLIVSSNKVYRFIDVLVTYICMTLTVLYIKSNGLFDSNDIQRISYQDNHYTRRNFPMGGPKSIVRSLKFELQLSCRPVGSYIV